MTLAFLNYLLLLAQFSFICTVSRHFLITVALTSLISYLFEKVSLTTSKSKLKICNYAYPNSVKILINLSPII